MHQNLSDSVSFSGENIKYFLKLLLFGKIERIEHAPEYKNDRLDESSEEFRKFKEHYDSEILPKLEDFEYERIEMLKEVRLRLLLAVVFAVIIVFVAQYIGYDTKSNSLRLPDTIGENFLALILIVPIWLFASAKPFVVNYIKNIRPALYPSIISFFRSGFSYEKDIGKELNFTKALKYAGLQHYIHPDKGALNYGIYLNNGFVEGRHKNKKIQFMETEVKRDTGKETLYRTTIYDKIFSGFLILITKEKKLSGDTVVTVGNTDKKYLSELKKLNETKSPHNFGSDVRIYTNNEDEAKHVVDEELITKLRDLAGTFKTENISCAFYEDKLLLRVPLKKRFFDVSIFKPITLIDDCNRFLLLMNKLFDITEVV